jgi:hypothetical protein
MLAAGNIRYEMADRVRAINCGGIGALHLLARHVGLPQMIDQQVRVFKRHLPCQESDHVLNLAYNALAGGTCIEDLERLRNDEAYLDADGSIAPTFGQCKEGMNISYDGQWGYHPLLISLANPKEPLYLVNRPGNRPSHEQADEYLDKSIALCRRARPDNVKEEVIREKNFKNFVLRWEDVAEFEHRPDLCGRVYRMVVLRKKVAVEQGQERLFEEYRYLFYITNDRRSTAEEIVFAANDRCDQENLIEQLKNGVGSMRNPLDNLHSNWAYMVMASLAWTLKAWCGLLLSAPAGRWRPRYQEQKRSILRMEFKAFVNGLIRLPCQIIKTGRRIVYRLLSCNPWAGSLLRLAEAVRRPMRC